MAQLAIRHPRRCAGNRASRGARRCRTDGRSTSSRPAGCGRCQAREPSAKTRLSACTRCSCAPPASRSLADSGPRRSSGSGDLDDLASHAADDALLAILSKLHTFRGDSRFTTWAYKFAFLEAAAAARKRPWHGREVPLEADGWAQLRDDRQASPEAQAEASELIGAIRDAIAEVLTPHQRAVLVAITLNDVPIDVLAERHATTRGALYKTLHDARRKLRARLAQDGLAALPSLRQPAMSPKSEPTAAHPRAPSSPIQRLLFVADAAVADVEELPPAVRAVIDAAAEVYVRHPHPPRPARLARRRCRSLSAHRRRAPRHRARPHALDRRARRRCGPAWQRPDRHRGRRREIPPDHILLALHSPEHAYWQERRLIEHIEQRFGLPLSTYAVDLEGHTATADGPLLLCYDGSEDAKHAIERAGELFHGRHALVVTVWQPTVLGGLGWAAASAASAAASSNSTERPPNSPAASPPRARASRTRRALMPSRSSSRPSAPSGRRSSRPPTSMTRRRSSWARADLGGVSGRGTSPTTPAAPKSKSKPKRRRRSGQSMRSRRRVRTVLATTRDNEAFGWHVAAEVHRRGLDQAAQKACLGDGSKAIWALFELHLFGAGFLGILDVVHLLVYLYAAAGAVAGRGTDEAWALYVQWLTWAWAGKVVTLLGALRAAHRRLGEAPANAAEDDPRKVVAEAAGYVSNNKGRMDYPRYRRLGLPTSSAPVESVIKQLNRRVKGSEKFWLPEQVEGIVQVRATYLSEDGRVEKAWKRPRPYQRTVGRGRLGRKAPTPTQ